MTHQFIPNLSQYRIGAWVLVFFITALISGNSHAIEIKYDVNTIDLSSLGATVSANDSNANNTSNGITSESYWGAHPQVGKEQFIAWQFAAGSMSVNAMQIINNEHWNVDHHLLHFALEYTTDLNPTLLGSTYQALNILDVVGLQSTINGNEINILTPSNDLDIIFESVNATAIRLHSFPFAGDHVGNGTDGNFLINEVSFNGTAVPEPIALNWMMLMMGSLLVFRRQVRKD